MVVASKRVCRFQQPGRSENIPVRINLTPDLGETSSTPQIISFVTPGNLHLEDFIIRNTHFFSTDIEIPIFT